MRSVAYIVLRFIHALHSVLLFAYSCWKRLAYVAPLSLTAPRRQIPKHLAILFIPDSETHYDLTEKCLLESVYRVLDWCREVGIATITFYDERGLLKALTPTIERHVSSSSLSLTDEDHSAYPPTPPLSDCASRSMSPVHPYTTSPFTVIHAPFDSRRAPGAGKFSRNSPEFTSVYIVSAEASKPTIAAVASDIAREEACKHSSTEEDLPFTLTVDDIKWRVEGKGGLPAADFMIVHPLSPSTYNRTALELHGFPLLQIRLTEIYHNRLMKRHDAWINWVLPSRYYSRRLPVPITEISFREALDEFAGAEMRFGK